MVSTLKLEIAKRGNSPIYAKGGRSFIIDLIYIDPVLVGERFDGKLSDRYTGN